MSATYGMSAAGIVGAGFAAILAALIPDPKFMTVHRITVDPVSGAVTAERSIHRDAVSDWSVTIVPDATQALAPGAPTCQTRAGPNLHEGWSNYSQSKRALRVLSMDDWVWDSGCWDRLPAGQHHMWITWTPRDETPAVTGHWLFEKIAPKG